MGSLHSVSIAYPYHGVALILGCPRIDFWAREYRCVACAPLFEQNLTASVITSVRFTFQLCSDLRLTEMPVVASKSLIGNPQAFSALKHAFTHLFELDGCVPDPASSSA